MHGLNDSTKARPIRLLKFTSSFIKPRFHALPTSTSFFREKIQLNISYTIYSSVLCTNWHPNSSNQKSNRNRNRNWKTNHLQIWTFLLKTRKMMSLRIGPLTQNTLKMPVGRRGN
jgi:hypothetical protein